MDQSIILIHFVLTFFVFSFVGTFLLLPDKISKNAYLFIVVFIEIEAISESKSYLEQIIIKTFLRYTYFSCCFLKRILFLHQTFITSTWIVFSPFNHFLDNISNSSLFSTSTLSFTFNWGMFLITILLFLLLKVGNLMMYVHQPINMKKRSRL